jgi:hypothetical protein
VLWVLGVTYSLVAVLVLEVDLQLKVEELDIQALRETPERVCALAVVQRARRIQKQIRRPPHPFASRVLPASAVCRNLGSIIY